MTEKERYLREALIMAGLYDDSSEREAMEEKIAEEQKWLQETFDRIRNEMQNEYKKLHRNPEPFDEDPKKAYFHSLLGEHFNVTE